MKYLLLILLTLTPTLAQAQDGGKKQEQEIDKSVLGGSVLGDKKKEPKEPPIPKTLEGIKKEIKANKAKIKKQEELTAAVIKTVKEQLVKNLASLNKLIKSYEAKTPTTEREEKSIKASIGYFKVRIKSAKANAKRKITETEAYLAKVKKRLTARNKKLDEVFKK